MISMTTGQVHRLEELLLARLCIEVRCWTKKAKALAFFIPGDGCGPSHALPV